MWESNAKLSGSITGIVWGALLCTFFTEYTSSEESEIYSELLCWLILPVLFRAAQYTDIKSRMSRVHSTKDDTQSRSPGSLWIVALSVGISCAYKTENRVIEFFVRLFQELLIAYRIN
jgi:hypothetical protein